MPNVPRIPEARERYSEDHLFPKFRGVGPQDAEEPIHGLPPFEISTLHHFLAAARTGNFPGKKTELPLWPEMEMQYFSKKYSEWAPKPYCDLPQPAAGPFGPVGGQSPPPAIRVTLALSSFDYMFNQLFTFAGQNLSPEEVARRLASADRGTSFNITKSKIWYGVAPVSEARWKAKGLDDEKNIEEALAILQSVVDVFDYFAQSEIQGKLRDIFNKVYTELDVFQDALNALRATQGELLPGWSISKLWQEYIRCHFDFMEKQARSWMFRHLKTLHLVWKAHLNKVTETWRVVNDTQASVRIDHWAMMVNNKIWDLYRDLDIIVRSRTDGFAMVYGVDPRLARIDQPASTLNAIYAQIELQRTTNLRYVLDASFRDITAARQAEGTGPMPEFLEAFCLIMDREAGHKRLQYLIDEPPDRQIETWVCDLSEDEVEMFGFVIYRLSYAETDEEWEAFRTKLEDGLDSVWDGIVGAEKIKQKAVLQWIDGREADNTPEGNLEAARKHFKDFTKTPVFATGLSSAVCLAVTPVSVSSFSEDNSSKKTGDFRGFLHAIDSQFDSNEVPPTTSTAASQRDRAKKSLYKPGYDGTFKILDQLVWPELFAMNVKGASVRFADMWTVSAQHPWAVYTGSTTGVTRRNWRELKGMGGHMLKLAKEKSDRDGLER